MKHILTKFKNPKVGLVCSNYWIIEDTKEKKIAHKKGRPSGNVLNYLVNWKMSFECLRVKKV